MTKTSLSGKPLDYLLWNHKIQTKGFEIDPKASNIYAMQALVESTLSYG